MGCYMNNNRIFDNSVISEEKSNTFLNILRDLNLLKNKHIPLVYLTSSRQDRLNLLSGIIDANGYLKSNCYEIIQENQNLTSNILFIARSLGFAAYSSICFENSIRKEIIHVSGKIEDIPVLLPHKMPLKKSCIEDVLKIGIKIEEIGKGEYYGFQIDGNSRFLLGDFTVTHNTALAKVIAYAFSKSGILATDTIKIVSRSDLVGQYIGQTAPRTRGNLLETLEGILFIDEAYQLSPDDPGRDFGPEAITEIVNFLDKYIGMSIVIVAGYEDKMTKNFFGSNEGLARRFPYRLTLSNYSISELTDILIRFVERSTEMQIDDETGNYLYSVIEYLDEEHKTDDIFSNQAGDMLNFGSSLVKAINGSFKVKWKQGNLENNTPILKEGLQDYLKMKNLYCV